MEKGKHWGDWLAARSRYVGFRRQSDLARAVGCNRERIATWIGMPAPPEVMHKGFDQKLAFALEITRSMLFSDWKNHAPDRVERTLFHVDQFPLVNHESWDPEMRDFVWRVLGNLAPSELERILQAAVIIGMGRTGEHTAAFQMISERINQLRRFAQTGEQAPVGTPMPPPEGREAPGGGPPRAKRQSEKRGRGRGQGKGKLRVSNITIYHADKSPPPPRQAAPPSDAGPSPTPASSPDTADALRLTRDLRAKGHSRRAPDN